ncbi:hypothetical protein PG993_011502 [Apiospora rasikravindrae]|uniref:Secreted protein n=1 Tax=Apiospora rasikravindrae TaxID=990691 RepID=A0ABR1SES6_9PEZI
MIALIVWIWAILVSTLVSGAAVQPNGGSAFNSSAPMPGIIWRGNVTVDGPIYEFNGTVQEIYAQIKKVNPAYELLPVSRERSSTNPKLSITHTECETPHGDPDNWGYAVTNEIDDGIAYLRGLTGECGATPGPCGRVSCSWDSAIAWCWNNPTGGYTLKCSELADYATEVVKQCPYRPNEVWGETYDSAGFSVFCAGKLHLC